MSVPPHTIARAYAGDLIGLRCSACGHFRQGPEGDRVQQCTNSDAPLYRASEYMDKATACKLYEVRG